jgi:hypothetical protein
MTFDHLFSNIIGRYTESNFYYLRVPQYWDAESEESITVDATHLCRVDAIGTWPIHESNGDLYLSEAGWNAHKHRLVGKIDPSDFEALNQLAEKLFEARRQHATRQRQDLLDKIAKLEACWPHLKETK